MLKSNSSKKLRVDLENILLNFQDQGFQKAGDSSITYRLISKSNYPKMSDSELVNFSKKLVFTISEYLNEVGASQIKIPLLDEIWEISNELQEIIQILNQNSENKIKDTNYVL